MEVGGYRIVASLSEGGRGRVQLARSASGQPVAVKTVHGRLAADPEFRARFRREAAAVRTVTGRCATAVLDADPDAAQPWYAVEFCAGPGLPKAVAAHGPLGGAELAALGAALAEALAALHAARLVHRDLKPSNVVITRDGPRIIGFGLARSAADEDPTAERRAVGSPGFVSPERLTPGFRPGPAADVFALGAVLTVAATGRGPFGSGGAPEVLHSTLHDEPDLLGVPDAAWEDFLGRCLARNPADRPTAAQVLAWCAGRAGGEPWWEQEPVAGQIRRQEDKVAEQLRQAEGGTTDDGAQDAPEDGTGRGPDDGWPMPAPGPPAPGPGAGFGAGFGAGSEPPADNRPTDPCDDITQPSHRPSRRRLFGWGSAALAAVGATAAAVFLGDEGGPGAGGEG
ncbi:serine/threonine-protein kinase [Streptomyces sp. NPDC046465]|uniref:serine/threonine-protein kinase n=1 Tax=Streptomyces sp. NPDC046465 TaxID=3155810 RepID=UPI0033F84938